MKTPRWTLRLDKEDFKFSAAHFTLFGATEAEPLHGHNYRVTVEIEGDELGAEGLLADTSRIKARVRALCDGLDDRVLLPERSPYLGIVTAEAGEVECRYGTRRYLFPRAEVLILPLANVSMELLARHLWSQLATDLGGRGLAALSIEVEETAGQSCRYAAPLGG